MPAKLPPSSRPPPASAADEAFRARLREAMEAEGMDDAQLADAAGVARSTIVRYRSGKRNWATMEVGNAIQIADALSVRMNWLFRGRGPMRTAQTEAARIARKASVPERHIEAALGDARGPVGEGPEQWLHYILKVSERERRTHAARRQR